MRSFKIGSTLESRPAQSCPPWLWDTKVLLTNLEEVRFCMTIHIGMCNSMGEDGRQGPKRAGWMLETANHHLEKGISRNVKVYVRDGLE
ncbi:predicted protein [Lichtheimia corymbifera JMRC:FSU:9682]|uniref:Uncharacterized protein n=1 Tax=Lichtheimia corymbifera JMRC:FSU:9682 TaxID=1263082 RepID=A0A068S279_9FUNG|nr:predicted protein [Lichtheimia corymbifera JMRC:FSU:9682]